jgi:CRP-like cAMP-binding protein/CheY-like chemotaxis protein
MGKKILLIEDNKEIRENTTEMLELAEYSVRAATNGLEGVEMAIAEKPDLILCDIMMPHLDGYGVLYTLAKNPETAGIPFIFLTAKTERADFRKGMEMGADDFITKPFDDVELLSAIESRLKKAEILRKDFHRNLEGLKDFMNESTGLDALTKLSEDRDVHHYRKKDTIYGAGAYPKGIYFVVKGKVKTYKTNELGKEFITGLYKEGEFFGHLPILEESKYTDDAMTLEESEICLIPKDSFNSLVYKNAEVSRKFIKMLSNELQDKEDQLIKLAYNSVRKRVAEALVTLHNRYHKDGEALFSIQISREDLANLAGTAPETAIRMLSDLKSEKLVEIKGSLISILDYDRLSHVKN